MSVASNSPDRKDARSRPIRHLGWNSGEHMFIGDMISLLYGPDDFRRAGDNPLQLTNGAVLTYGQINALGGDFYATPDLTPISNGATLAAQQALFRSAFGTLAADTSVQAVVTRNFILGVIQSEADIVNQVSKMGLPPSQAYSAIGELNSGLWNVITGGSAPIGVDSTIGRYLQISSMNMDHFGADAVAAYCAGHSLALQAAQAAGKNKDESALSAAYAMNAFADHFLEDLFSAGHVRTPRRAMYKTLGANPSAKDVQACALCAMFMHNEDCLSGLRFTNKRGFVWTGFGDGRLFDDVNAKNFAMVLFAVMYSAYECYLVYSGQPIPSPANYLALQWIPDLSFVNDRQRSLNYYPMYNVAGDGGIQFRERTTVFGSYRWEQQQGSYSYESDWTFASHGVDLEADAYAASGFAPTPPPAPTAAPNGTPGPAATLVRYATRYFVNNVESYQSPWTPWVELDPSVGVSVANIATIPSPPANPDIDAGRRVYRQIVQPVPWKTPNALRFIVELADNTTTSYVDKTPLEPTGAEPSRSWDDELPEELRGKGTLPSWLAEPSAGEQA